MYFQAGALGMNAGMGGLYDFPQPGKFDWYLPYPYAYLVRRGKEVEQSN